MTQAKRAADDAYSLAQMAFTGAELNNNRTQTTKLRVEELLQEIGDFLSNQGATPAAIRAMANAISKLEFDTPAIFAELAWDFLGCQVLSFHRERGQSFLRAAAFRGTSGGIATRRYSRRSSPWTIDVGSARMGSCPKRPSRAILLEVSGAFR